MLIQKFLAFIQFQLWIKSVFLPYEFSFISDLNLPAWRESSFFSSKYSINRSLILVCMKNNTSLYKKSVMGLSWNEKISLTKHFISINNAFNYSEHFLHLVTTTNNIIIIISCTTIDCFITLRSIMFWFCFRDTKNNMLSNKSNNPINSMKLKGNA